MRLTLYHSYGDSLDIGSFAVLEPPNSISPKNTLGSSFDIELSPNPSAGLLNLRFCNASPSKANISIVNSMGAEFLNRDFDLIGHDHIELDVSACASGRYYLVYRSESILRIKKFVVEN
jgi:hypothetical protein